MNIFFKDISKEKQKEYLKKIVYSFTMEIKDSEEYAEAVYLQLGQEVFKNVWKHIKNIRSTENEQNECLGYTSDRILDSEEYNQYIISCLSKTEFLSDILNNIRPINSVCKVEVVEKSTKEIPEDYALLNIVDIFGRDITFKSTESDKMYSKYEHLKFKEMCNFLDSKWYYDL